jgi:hypothetical protein
MSNNDKLRTEPEIKALIRKLNEVKAEYLSRGNHAMAANIREQVNELLAELEKRA